MASKSDTKKPSVELQSIIDALDNPFVLIDENYQIVSANRAYCDTYDIDMASVIGMKCYKVSHQSDVPCHQNGEDCPHKTVFETWNPHQVLHIHFDGDGRPEQVRIKGTPVNGANGERYLGETVYRLTRPGELDCNEQAIMGKSPAFLSFLEQLTRAAETSASVLLSGESGVGKDLAAQYIHRLSSRKGMSFVHLPCASIHHDAFECELFGHEKGAFNGCAGRRFGLFEKADGGTLLIDEIGELPYSMQGRLLRALETGSYHRVDGQETLHADVRVVSASRYNLLELVEKGTFRADLYYRIAGIKIDIPPLRDRRTDIPALAEALLQRIGDEGGRRCSLHADALEKLLAHDFPGNMDELRNILQQAVILSTNGIITADMIQINDTGQYRVRRLQDSKAVSIREMEAQHIAALLKKYRGHRRKVAEELGISERTLYRKIDKYNLTLTGKQD